MLDFTYHQAFEGIGIATVVVAVFGPLYGALWEVGYARGAREARRKLGETQKDAAQ
jgi:hypothetical protein